MGRVLKILVGVIPIALVLWGLFSIFAQVSYQPASRRSWPRREGGWVHGAEAIKMGVLWLVVGVYAAAELWLPEGTITKPIRVLMGMLIIAIVLFTAVLVP